MSTTSLFVELVVIGIGAAIWVALLTLALFGYQWIPADKAFSIPTAIPVLAVVYVLGIVSDRMIDILFDRFWGTNLRLKHFPDTQKYHEARRTVLTSSDAMSEIIEYSRSRLRICRGWAVHSFLIAIALVVFALTRIANQQVAIGVSVYGGVAFSLLGASSWCAWRYLNTTQYLKISEQASFLVRNGRGGTGEHD